MSELTEFLRARIAEDEARVEGIWQGEGDPDFFWGPDRIRAECRAKREVVDHADRWAETLHATPEHWTSGDATVYRMAMDWTVRLLATAYADHPDYDEEWRP